MDELHNNYKRWTDAIGQEQFSGVADELEESIKGKITVKENNIIFKLLQHVANASAKCDVSNQKKGFEVKRLACWICSHLTDILDSDKFFACVYHITSYLLDSKLPHEATKVSDFLLPGGLWQNDSKDCRPMFTKVSQLYNKFATNRLQSKNFHPRYYKTMEYELDLTILAYSNPWRYVLSKLLSYCKTMEFMDSKLKDDFSHFALCFLSDRKIHLDEKNIEHSYRSILLIIGAMALGDLEKTKSEIASNVLTRYLKIFKNCFNNYETYAYCYELYEHLAMALVRPMEKLTARTVDRMNDCTKKFTSVRFLEEYRQAVKWYSYAVVLLLTAIITEWENCAKTDKFHPLNAKLLTSMFHYLNQQCGVFANYNLDKCWCGRPNVCRLKYDLHNDVTVRLKALSVVTIISSKNKDILTADLCKIFEIFSEKCLESIRTIKHDRCDRWTTMWTNVSSHTYNFGVSCESKFHETSVELYSKLLKRFLEFEGPEEFGNDGKPKQTLLKLRWPLSSILHRLGSVNSSHGNPKEASIFCCLNALISSRRPCKIAERENNDEKKSLTVEPKISDAHKAFATWAILQHKHPTLRGLTIFECFRSNSKKIFEMMKLPSDYYDKTLVCSLQIKALADTRIDLTSTIVRVIHEMEQLRVAPAIYARAVQSFGYHLLNLGSEYSIADYLATATRRYEREKKPSMSFKLSYGHIKFYEFRQRLNQIGLKTEDEIKSAVRAITSARSKTDDETEKIVPTYSTINLNVTMSIATSLERALTLWKNVTSVNGYVDELEHWEIDQTLEVAIVAGEYARFYHLENLEIEAWKLSHELARKLNDNRAIVYTTMRSLSSQRVDRDWIERANKSLETIKYQKIDDSETKRVVEAYKISLAELYHQNDDKEMAEKTFLPTMKWFDETFMAISTHLLSAINLKFKYCSNTNDDDDHMGYTRIIVTSLYTMLAINDSCQLPKASNFQRDQLYNYDVLFDFTSDLAPRLNSLVAYREISAHVMSRLSVAQKMGAALRVAECLKTLCYIDLTRASLDDCEVKLQAIEHILEIEGFDLTMASKMSPMSGCDRTASTNSSSNHVVEIVRDIGQNDASPVLRTKIFANPDFVLHSNECTCFKCTNSRYQSLVFASTHIRAQLFSLRRNSTAALQHFEGALTIKRNILSRTRENDDSVTSLRTHRQLDLVEFVTLHLDYCRFIKWSKPQRTSDLVEIGLAARRLCVDFNLVNHPIWVTTNELLFEYRFEKLYGEGEFAKFTVPAVEDIDISRYVTEPTTDTANSIICATPIRPAIAQKSYSVRRKKTPPFLKLEKVPLHLSEEESPTLIPQLAETRRTGRRKFTEIQQEPVSILEVSNESDKSTDSGATIVIPVDDDSVKTVEAPKRSGRTRKDRGNSVELMESESTTSEVPTKITTKTRGKSKRTTAVKSKSEVKIDDTLAIIVDDSAAIPIIEIEEVTELLEEMSVTDGRSRVSGRSSGDKRNTATIAIASDVSAASGDDGSYSGTRRTRSRLKNKSQPATSTDTSGKVQSSVDTSPSMSDDDVVILETKTKKRIVEVCVEDDATVKQSSRTTRSTRATSKRNT